MDSGNKDVGPNFRSMDWTKSEEVMIIPSGEEEEEEEGEVAALTAAASDAGREAMSVEGRSEREEIEEVRKEEKVHADALAGENEWVRARAEFKAHRGGEMGDQKELKCRPL